MGNPQKKEARNKKFADVVNHSTELQLRRTKFSPLDTTKNRTKRTLPINSEKTNHSSKVLLTLHSFTRKKKFFGSPEFTRFLSFLPLSFFLDKSCLAPSVYGDKRILPQWTEVLSNAPSSSFPPKGCMWCKNKRLTTSSTSRRFLFGASWTSAGVEIANTKPTASPASCPPRQKS